MTIVPRDPNSDLLLGELEELERRWPDGQRLLAAFTLACDLDACRDLILGLPVDVARLDPGELQRARQAHLVQLRAPADLLHVDGIAA